MPATDEPDEHHLAGRVPRRAVDDTASGAADGDDGTPDEDELDTVTRLLGFLRDSD